jgi:DNA-binding CsgD family transcriptional regulator
MFCLGLSAGGILVLFRRKEYRHYSALRYLQFYLILIFTFGFYALWSQILLRNLFFAVLRPEDLAALARFLILLSVPFLLAGKLMLVLWTVQVVNRPVRSYLLPSLIPLGVLILLIPLGQGIPLTLYRAYAILVLVLMTWVGVQLVFSEVRYLQRRSKTVLAVLVLGVGILHGLLWMDLREIPTFELLFVVLYFLMHTAFVTYFMYQAVLPDPNPTELGLSHVAPDFTDTPTFEEFVEAYGITPRETEIIQEIYQGKTNREIAERLFVTVQTIKDHTHRIYQKTDVKSRSQLALLLRNFQKIQ